MITRHFVRAAARIALLAAFACILVQIRDTAFAQEVPGGEALAIFVDIFYVLFTAFYIYLAISTQFIAKKTGTPNGWMAWIPFANFILWAKIARRPIWWGFLCLIPLVNVVFWLLLWMGIAAARNKPTWWGILMIAPIVQVVVPGYLAWSK